MEFAVTRSGADYIAVAITTKGETKPLYNFGGCRPSCEEFVREDAPEMTIDAIAKLIATYNHNRRVLRIFEPNSATLKPQPVIVEHPKPDPKYAK